MSSACAACWGRQMTEGPGRATLPGVIPGALGLPVWYPFGRFILAIADTTRRPDQDSA